VNVTVVEAVAATMTIESPIPTRPLEGVHLVVLGVEEVHHLIAQVRDRRLARLGVFVHVHDDRFGDGAIARIVATTLQSAS